MQVAIDGPASSGKSTISKLIAQETNFLYLDTGAMYRATTLAFLRNNIAVVDNEAIKDLLENLVISFKNSDDGQLVFLNGDDVTREIRNLEVTRNVSAVSAIKAVRKKLVEMQRKIANNHSIIMDGRDIGTVVLPNAELKIYLVASVQARALRRFKENQEKGIDLSLEKLEEEIAHRDFLDSTRKESPLKKADDAIEIDTTSLSIQEVVSEITNLIQEKMLN
ncbi:(d)CMP kinase [uncultured Granulicatella sp.]|uniref:(d)CMP kinase n=1 Tax=uncultured Granulicatella sp. TaxID=316089 RepID=UPI002620C688|nr:(d)CMP kinase [uncultured Granulicatella sp.]